MKRHTYIEKHKTGQKQRISYIFGLAFEELILLLGLLPASKLVKYFGGTFLYIPAESTARRKIRNQAIREMYLSGEYSQKELGERFGLKPSTISTILGKKADRYRPELLYQDRVLSQRYKDMKDMLNGDLQDYTADEQ